MFLLNNLASKLKHIISSNASHVRLSIVIFGMCSVAIVWIYYIVDSIPSHVPMHLRRYLLFAEDFTIPEKRMSEAELNDLILKVNSLNCEAEVRNWDMYRSVQPNTTFIVILVHTDVERLQHLVISLGQVRHIRRVLLIFSHSYFDEEINYLVKSINFCMVMQIFYPYSMQLYPKQFPGVEPDDCNATLPAGAEPCRKRDARRVQHKQHWWWTANFIFDGEWKSAKRFVIFLNEEDYVLPDLLHMLQLTRRVLPYFPAVEVISFGGPHAGRIDYGSVTINSWAPPYGSGLAFNKSTWRKISERSPFFCFCDDCSWSYSLVPVFGNFSGGVAEVAVLGAARVLSTGGAVSGLRGARGVWAASRRARLFPAAMRAVVALDARGRLQLPDRAPHDSSGCGDLRDRILCLDPLMAATAETATETAEVFSTHTNLIKNILHAY